MSRAATVTLATELLRLGCASAAAGEQLNVNLLALADGVSRARASARFAVSVFMPWIGGPLGSIQIVDARGYAVGWSLSQVASFLARSLPEKDFSVMVAIDHSAKIPARWTDARLDSLAGKVSALDPAAIRAAAAAKRATVASWVEGERRAAVLAAADRMDECAGVVDAIRAGLPFGDQGGGGGGEQA